MNSLAVIPARGGSKRIPHKNIKDFLGQPIISYPITAALTSTCFDEVMVSTDSQEIAEISRSYGATVPFLRSAKASGDYATTLDVLQEVFLEYDKLGRQFSQLCCLYPTAVFTTSKMIQQAHAILQQGEADGVTTFVRYEHPIERAFELDNAGKYVAFRNKIFFDTRTQDLPATYYDAGQMYFLTRDAILIEKTVFPQRTQPLILTSMQVQDIDNLDDWNIAELKYNNYRGKMYEDGTRKILE